MYLLFKIELDDSSDDSNENTQKIQSSSYGGTQSMEMDPESSEIVSESMEGIGQIKTMQHCHYTNLKLL